MFYATKIDSCGSVQNTLKQVMWSAISSRACHAWQQLQHDIHFPLMNAVARVAIVFHSPNWKIK
jgi:hypothetical protein